MAEAIRKVLDHIVDHYAVRDDQKEIDLNAPPMESGADIESDKQHVARREEDRADELADAFRQGLLLAHRARAAGQDQILLDDRIPAQDRLADALIQFLVRHDLATSRAEETEPMHYIYAVAVDWDRLQGVARAANVDLAQALAP